MDRKLLVSVIVFASMALAADKAKTYDLKLYQPAMVGDTELKAGEYRLKVMDDQKAVIKGGKLQKEAAVQVEQSDSKFNTTSVRLSTGDKPQIQEIRLGGTKTKLVFTGGNGANGM